LFIDLLLLLLFVMVRCRLTGTTLGTNFKHHSASGRSWWLQVRPECGTTASYPLDRTKHITAHVQLEPASVWPAVLCACTESCMQVLSHGFFLQASCQASIAADWQLITQKWVHALLRRR
jgi:hypothetical protein